MKSFSNRIALVAALFFAASAFAGAGCSSKATKEECQAAAENVLKVLNAELAGEAANTEQLLRASKIAGDAGNQFLKVCPTTTSEVAKCFTNAKTGDELDACKKKHEG